MGFFGPGLLGAEHSHLKQLLPVALDESLRECFAIDLPGWRLHRPKLRPLRLH
jgi:hypothetical protein